MKKLLLFAAGFLIYAVSALFMFSQPYTKTIIHRGEPVEIMLYRDFYAGLPYHILGAAIMFVALFIPIVVRSMARSSKRFRYA